MIISDFKANILLGKMDEELLEQIKKGEDFLKAHGWLRHAQTAKDILDILYERLEIVTNPSAKECEMCHKMALIDEEDRGICMWCFAKYG